MQLRSGDSFVIGDSRFRLELQPSHVVNVAASANQWPMIIDLEGDPNEKAEPDRHNSAAGGDHVSIPTSNGDRGCLPVVPETPGMQCGTRGVSLNAEEILSTITAISMAAKDDSQGWCSDPQKRAVMTTFRKMDRQSQTDTHRATSSGQLQSSNQKDDKSEGVMHLQCGALSDAIETDGLQCKVEYDPGNAAVSINEDPRVLNSVANLRRTDDETGASEKSRLQPKSETTGEIDFQDRHTEIGTTPCMRLDLAAPYKAQNRDSSQLRQFATATNCDQAPFEYSNNMESNPGAITVPVQCRAAPIQDQNTHLGEARTHSHTRSHGDENLYLNKVSETSQMEVSSKEPSLPHDHHAKDTLYLADTLLKRAVESRDIESSITAGINLPVTGNLLFNDSLGQREEVVGEQVKTEAIVQSHSTAAQDALQNDRETPERPTSSINEPLQASPQAPRIEAITDPTNDRPEASSSNAEWSTEDGLQPPSVKRVKRIKTVLRATLDPEQQRDPELNQKSLRAEAPSANGSSEDVNHSRDSVGDTIEVQSPKSARKGTTLTRRAKTSPGVASESPDGLASLRSSGRSYSSASRTEHNSNGTGLKIVLASSSDVEGSSRLTNFLTKQGVTQVKSVPDCDILCIGDGEELKKTVKLIQAVSLGKAIVTDAWVKESAQERVLLNHLSYVPRDPTREREWGTTLTAAIERGRQGVKPLLGWKVHCTPFVKKDLGNAFIELKSIAIQAGATSVQASLPRRSANDAGTTIVVASEHDPQSEDLRKEGWRCFTKDIITLSVLRGVLDVDSDEFLIKGVESNQGGGRKKRKR